MHNEHSAILFRQRCLSVRLKIVTILYQKECTHPPCGTGITLVFSPNVVTVFDSSQFASESDSTYISHSGKFMSVIY